MGTDAQCNLIIDTACDLPYSLVNVPGVEVLQFPYTLSDGEHFDDMYVSMSAHQFYELMQKGEVPSTAQIPIVALTDAFTRAAQSGVPTVYLSFSSGLSGSCTTAGLVCDQVRESFPEAQLHVVDTHLASIAEGLLVYEAIKQRNGGMSASEMVAWVEEARYFVNELFTLDTLDALQRGGRIPSSVAFAESKINVKPMLDITLEGKLGLKSLARGRKKAIRQMAEFYEKHALSDGSSKLVIIGNADCPKDAERLKEELLRIDGGLVFLDTSIGPVIGSHVGRGMLALSFWGNDARETASISDRIARKVRRAN